MSAAGSRDIETHFTVIAVVNLLVAVPGLLLGALFFFGGLVGAGFVQRASEIPGLGALVVGAGLFLGLLLVVLALPGIVSAIGLLQRRSWAKTWTIVVGVVSLVNFPLGTLFGIYAIWAMTRPETDRALG